MAVMRLSAVLYALAALVQVSQAIHFTNQQWDVHDNETFLFEWAYDYTDPDPDTFLTMITLLAYDVEFPWSNNYSNLIFNETYDRTVTTFNWTVDCKFNLLISSYPQYMFSIDAMLWNVPVSIGYSEAWALQSGSHPCRPTTANKSLSTGAKAGIGIGVAIAVIGLAAAVYFIYRKRRLAKAAAVAPQKQVVTPEESIQM